MSGHIGCRTQDIGGYVLLPGDPGRCQSIAQHLEESRLIAQNREFTTYTGLLLGEKVSVTSTGIGCPSTAIAVEELSMIGAHTFIRVGTCGGMQPYLALGDLVVVTAAVRDEGTSRQYIPLEYPAVADIEVTNALCAAGRTSNRRVHVGIAHSKDSFYGQHQPERMPIAAELAARWSAWKAGNVLCSEMESATLFVVSKILSRRSGTVLVVAGNQERSEMDLARDQERGYDLSSLIRIAVGAIKILIQSDLALASSQSSPDCHCG